MKFRVQAKKRKNKRVVVYLRGNLQLDLQLKKDLDYTWDTGEDGGEFRVEIHDGDKYPEIHVWNRYYEPKRKVLVDNDKLRVSLPDFGVSVDDDEEIVFIPVDENDDHSDRDS